MFASPNPISFEPVVMLPPGAPVLPAWLPIVILLLPDVIPLPEATPRVVLFAPVTTIPAVLPKEVFPSPQLALNVR